MDNRKTVFLIVGQTASGKDSLVNAMCDKAIKSLTQDMLGQYTVEPYKQLISYTTRPRRKSKGGGN